MNNNRRYTFEEGEEHLLKAEIVHAETNIEEEEEVIRLAKERLFIHKQRKDALVAHNPEMCRKRTVKKKLCTVDMITRNGQRYVADDERCIEACIISGYLELENIKRRNPTAYGKLKQAEKRLSTKFIYEMVEKLDKRVVQRGENALKKHINKKKFIFAHRNEDIKHNKTDSKTCREAYNCWHIQLHMD